MAAEIAASARQATSSVWGRHAKFPARPAAADGRENAPDRQAEPFSLGRCRPMPRQ